MSEFSRYIEAYQTKKSVQRKDRFFVIISRNFANDPIDVTRLNLVQADAQGAIIPPYCISEIQIPEHEFDRVKYHGHKSIAVIKRDSLDFTITFEEDDLSTVNKFLRYCQLKNVNPGNGFTRPIRQQYLDEIVWKQFDQAGNVIETGEIKNAKLIKITESTKTASSNESNKYIALFSAETITYEFTRQ